MATIYLDSDEWRAIRDALKVERGQIDPNDVAYIKWLDSIILKIEVAVGWSDT